MGVLVAVLAAAAGCAGAMERGRGALVRGQWEDASRYFGAAVAKDPDKVDALVGLGIARYHLADFTGATERLGQALARAANQPTARLYLGLTYLMIHNDAGAAEQLTAFRGLIANDPIAPQVDRALTLLRGAPLADDMRQFVAASLENEAALVRQLQEAQAAAGRPGFGPAIYIQCISTARGRFLCF